MNEPRLNYHHLRLFWEVARAGIGVAAPFAADDQRTDQGLGKEP
jgi:hypothetical protein